MWLFVGFMVIGSMVDFFFLLLASSRWDVITASLNNHTGKDFSKEEVIKKEKELASEKKGGDAFDKFLSSKKKPKKDIVEDLSSQASVASDET